MNTRVKQNPYHTQAALRKLSMKQKISPETLDWISLTLLAHLDSCKRGRGDIFSANVVSVHILIAVSLASLKQNRAFYNVAVEAFNMFNKANARPDPVSLTTGEYAALRACFKVYLGHVLPNAVWDEYLRAEFSAFESFKIEHDMRHEIVAFTRCPPD